MNRKKLLILGAAVVLVGAGLLWRLDTGHAKNQAYRFVTVESRDIEATVSSTGTLEAVTTIEVGTQVSGIISDIFSDFNDQVTAGQVIARLDTTLLEIAVRQAEAELQRNRAELLYAQRDRRRAGCFPGRFQASSRAAELSLERARQNLTYATIRAPISGTVLERNVDVGQTVAASLSAPVLFLIAADLTCLQILVSVDESDIGKISDALPVRFTVQAYPDDTFTGIVRQTRLQSATEENVVTYSVVVDVTNADLRLLPGMTATVDFLIDSATDVLAIPNAGLRFRPSQEQMAEIFARRTGGQSSRAGAGGGPPSDQAGRGDFAMLFFLDEAGNLDVRRVRPGLSDGQYTQVQGRELEAGLQVIAGITTGAQQTASNPFSGQQQSRRRGPPGMF